MFSYYNGILSASHLCPRHFFANLQVFTIFKMIQNRYLIWDLEKKVKGNVFADELDVTDDMSVNKFINRILSDHNRIDILVNNSGYQFDRNIWYKKFHEGTIEELQRIIEVDLKGSV